MLIHLAWYYKTIKNIYTNSLESTTGNAITTCKHKTPVELFILDKFALIFTYLIILEAICGKRDLLRAALIFFNTSLGKNKTYNNINTLVKRDSVIRNCFRRAVSTYFPSTLVKERKLKFSTVKSICFFHPAACLSLHKMGLFTNISQSKPSKWFT